MAKQKNKFADFDFKSKNEVNLAVAKLLEYQLTPEFQALPRLSKDELDLGKKEGGDDV